MSNPVKDGETDGRLDAAAPDEPRAVAEFECWTCLTCSPSCQERNGHGSDCPSYGLPSNATAYCRGAGHDVRVKQ